MTTFDEFWQWYQRMHAHPTTRALHAAATASAAFLLVGALLMRNPWLALAAPAVDYAIAQASHRLIEHNATRPWRHPIWHLRAELRLFARTISGA